MSARQLFNDLSRIGFQELDAAAVMGLRQYQVNQIKSGQELTPLEDRHAIGNYTAFIRRARIWAKDKTGNIH